MIAYQRRLQALRVAREFPKGSRIILTDGTANYTGTVENVRAPGKSGECVHVRLDDHPSLIWCRQDELRKEG